MKLIAYLEGGATPNIRPAPADRDWMDASPQRFAYRCLPLAIANAHGWEALTPARVKATWNGGTDLDALRVETDAPAHLRPISHFGSGILTFHVGCLLRTEPGYDLWVGGPPNRPKHGIAPLTGIVETDWSAYTFTMNWRFTAPGSIVFEKDEPYCFFFPLARSTLVETEPEYRNLKEDASLASEFETWREARQTFNKDLKVPGSSAQAEGWQRAYFHGRNPSGAPAPAGHRTRQRLKPFARPK